MTKLDEKCPRCLGSGWVCERHLNEPMDHDVDACAGAGVECACGNEEAFDFILEDVNGTRNEIQ